MGLNIGILSGIGEASREHQSNLLNMEVDRRKRLQDFWAKQLEDPDNTEEAQEVIFKKFLTLAQTPYDTKLPKDMETIEDVMRVTPRAGSESWLGGKTSRTISAIPAPIQASLGETPAIPRFPVPVDFEVPAPKPPHGYTVPGKLTQSQKEARAERAIRFKARTEAAAKAEFAAPQLDTAPFGPDSSGLYDKTTGRVVREPNPKLETKDNSITETELAMLATGGDAQAREAWDMIQQAKLRSGSEVGGYIPLVDQSGVVAGAWNPKSGRYVPTPMPGLRRTPVPPGIMTDIKDYENSYRKIMDLGMSYKPEFTGPVQGRWELSKAHGILAYLPLLRTPEGYGEFLALNADLKNSIIKLITGTAMGPQEAERIMRQIPVETDKDELWKSKYEQTKKNAKFLLDKVNELYQLVPSINPPSSPNDGPQPYPEGTVLKNPSGETMVKRNGQWVRQ